MEDRVEKLDGVAYALRANYHTALEKSPTTSVFRISTKLENWY